MASGTASPTTAATNTVIVGLPVEEDALRTTLEGVRQGLQELALTTPPGDNYRLIPLPSFRKMLIMCQNHAVSQQVFGAIQRHGPHVAYTPRDNNVDGLTGTSSKDFLELPPELLHTRFLISPPPSPPVDWDYDVVEEGPNTQRFHDIHELLHLLFERLHSLADPLQAQLVAPGETLVPVVEPLVLHESRSHPIIVLDPPAESSSSSAPPRSLAGVHTALPPVD